MERVAILGSVGSGKSTLATELSRRTGLPVVHLDPIFWRAEWTPAPRAEAAKAFRAAVAGERWILDGNFLSSESDGWDERFERADTVVVLDFPRRTCLWRVVKRVVRDRGKSRPDLPDGCREGLGLSVIRWIWSYPTTDRPRVLRTLERLPNETAVHTLRSAADVWRFLEEGATARPRG
jgi:adenylate kinase family enzyme